MAKFPQTTLKALCENYCFLNMLASFKLLRHNFNHRASSSEKHVKPGLTPISSFIELTGEAIYDTVDKVDSFVGMVSE